jgi:GNAT superfamily N-acetyltransferase
MAGWMIRSAETGDERPLAQLSLMAGHGFLEVLYQGVFPGQTLEDVVMERRLRNPRSIGHIGHWRVAAAEDGSLLGAINAIAPDVVETIEADPEVPPERALIFTPFRALDPQTDNTYYINMLAVFPQHRHLGVARALVDDAVAMARQASQPAVTLLTFEEDNRLVQYYRRLGFEITGSQPVIPHPYFRHGGNILAMLLAVSA